MPLLKTGSWWDKVQSQIEGLTKELGDEERALETAEVEAEEALLPRDETVEIEERRADALAVVKKDDDEPSLVD